MGIQCQEIGGRKQAQPWPGNGVKNHRGGGGEGNDDDESYAVTVILHISNTDILHPKYTQHPTDFLPKHSNIR